MMQDWRDYTDRADEPWVRAMLANFPSCYACRVRYRSEDRVLVVPWFAAIVDAWGEETIGAMNEESVKALVQSVREKGPAVASMLLVKLARQDAKKRSVF